TFGRAKRFSSLDMASGYWQIRIKREDREKTAFITKRVEQNGISPDPEKVVM
ncbi:17948_t:CDS:2, partial [Gigaspora rosea]